MSKYLRATLEALIDPVTKAVVGWQGVDGIDYLVPLAPSASGQRSVYQMSLPLANKAKVFPNNGASATYTLPADTSYAYITSSSALLQVTLPAGSADIDGMLVTIVTSNSVGTLTWISSGVTFTGAPATSTANVPMRMIYDNSTKIWYPA